MVALCDDPVDIENGMVTFNGTLVGDMANYTCDLGYELIENATTTCTLVDTDSAEFQPAPPSCRREYTDKFPGMAAFSDACVNHSSMHFHFGLKVHLFAYVYGDGMNL